MIRSGLTEFLFTCLGLRRTWKSTVEKTLPVAGGYGTLGPLGPDARVRSHWPIGTDYVTRVQLQIAKVNRKTQVQIFDRIRSHAQSGAAFGPSDFRVLLASRAFSLVENSISTSHESIPYLTLATTW